MQAFFTSVPLVAIAEMGDKTQLLSLILAARYRVFWPIVAGITVATTLNHGASAWFGLFLGEAVAPRLVQLGAGALFLLIGLWVLKPDTCEEMPGWLGRFGAFGATCIAFFLAEMGDKTQLATVTLAAHYHSFFAVTLGTTVGMLVANIPAVWLGEALLARLPMRAIRVAAAVLFIGFGLWALWHAW